MSRQGLGLGQAWVATEFSKDGVATWCFLSRPIGQACTCDEVLSVCTTSLGTRMSTHTNNGVVRVIESNVRNSPREAGVLMGARQERQTCPVANSALRRVLFELLFMDTVHGNCSMKKKKDPRDLGVTSTMLNDEGLKIIIIICSTTSVRR